MASEANEPARPAGAASGARAGRWGRRWLALGLIVAVVVSVLAWGLSDEVLHSWVFPRVEDSTPERLSEFARALSVRRDVRLLAPLLAAGLGLLWLRYARLARWLAELRGELAGLRQRVGWVGALFLAAWLVSYLPHAYQAFSTALDDWATFGWADGDRILPNMSQSNRDAIRLCKARTPEHARLVVATDQKAFFLSYYLLPRRLYHRFHPDAVHAVPRGGDWLPAYRLGDLPAEWLASKRSPLILEWFDQPPRVLRLRPTPGAEGAP